ncbi:aldehyde oxidase GLOX-like [Rosa sericea]
MEAKSSVLLVLSLCSVLFTFGGLASQASHNGKWKLLKKSIGISAMHMALLPNDKVIVFDRTDAGPSNLTLPQKRCGKDEICYAHSVEFNPGNRNFRPLTISTDTWCSSGALSKNGEIIQTGGYGLGERVVRHFKPCVNCDWKEDQNGLNVPRWYASNQVLPDGRVVIVGGRFQFNYEFVPKSKIYSLPFLEETRYSAFVPNNLYPFVHLAPNGNLFIFANDRAILLDYVNNVVVKRFPVLPGGVSRNYPSTGSSALLPISLVGQKSSGTNFPAEAEVLVCGGTVADANVKADAGVFVPASKTCGRLVITSKHPKWEVEEMPINRVMGDMIMLPTGDVLIINGAAKGTAGWGVAREPVLNPVLYKPWNKKPSRFEVLTPTTIPRLYHSTAHLLSDGRVLVGGSNPNANYNFTALYPTELSLEAFSPPYLNPSSTKSRPVISSVKPGLELRYVQKFYVGFRLNYETDKIYVTMVAPSFTTHSFAMNQRLLVLDMGHVRKSRTTKPAGSKSNHYYSVESYAPARPELAPPGYYLLFVVCDGVPSRGMWVRIK